MWPGTALASLPELMSVTWWPRWRAIAVAYGLQLGYTGTNGKRYVRTALWPSRWPLRRHERLQSRPRMHIHVVVRFGYLECIGAYVWVPRTAPTGMPLCKSWSPG
jgi:hypothetical protein